MNHLNKSRKIITVPEIKDFFTKGHERSLKAKKNILASFIFKGGSILANLLLVPLTLHYLDIYKYGIWITLYSIIGWFTFFDIGLGNGLRNKYAEALAKGERVKARVYVSTTYVLLTVIVITFYLICIIINPYLDWSKLLNTSPALRSELSKLVLIVFGFFCIKFVLQLIGTILIADQRPAYNSLNNFANNLVTLIIVYILTITTDGSLVYLGITISITPVIIFTFESFYFYKKDYKEFIPSLKYVDFSCAKDLMSLGFNFFILQLGAIVLFATDNIIISQLFGPNEVTPYNIAYKYFTIMIMIYMIIMSPLWTAYTDAYFKSDFDWIKNINKKSKILWYIISAIVVLMLLVSPLVYKIWVGKTINIEFYLSMTMAAYVLVYTFNSIYVTFINGVGKIRLQILSAVLSIIINIPLAIILARDAGLGIKGVMLATVICMLINAIWLPIQYNKIITKSAVGIWAK